MATSQPKIRTFVEIQTPDGKKYYVEPSTKFSTYTFPADAVIFSNVTKQIIYRPPGMNVNVKQHGDPAQCQPQQQGQLGSPPNPNPQQQPHPGQQQQQLTQQQQQAYMQQMRQQQQPGQPGVTPSPNPQQSQQLGQPGQPSPQQHLQSGQQQQQQPHPGQQQQQLTPQQQAYMQQMRMRQMQQQQMQQQQMQQQQMQQQQMQQQQMQQQQMRQPQSGHQQQQLTPQQQAYMQQMRMRHMQQQQMQQPKQPAFPAQQPPPPAFPSQQPPPPAFPAQQPPPPAFPSQQPPPPPFPVQAPPPPQQPTPTPPQQQPQQQAPPLPTGGAPSPPPPPPSLPPAGLASAQGGASLPPPTPPVSGDADPQQVPQQAPPPDILPPHIDSGAPQSPQPRPNQQSVNQRRPNSTNQNMLNSTNQRPNSINQGRPRSTTQGSRVLEPPYCGPPPFKLSQTHIPKTKELIQRYVPLILNMDLYFPPRRGHALYKNNSDPNLIGGSHSRHKSGELEFINLISETISYKSSDASEAEVNQLEEIASSPPPTPPSSAAEEQPSLPTPASEEQPSSPPPASEEQPSSPPPASEEQPSSPPPASEEQPSLPTPASEEQPSSPPPASEEQPSSPPPASEEQPSSPPPASEEQPSPPSSAAEEQPSLPTPATEEQPSSSPPAAEEQPSLPPPSTEEQPSPPSSAAEEPPPPHPPALAPAPKPKKPKPTKPTKPKHTETKEEIMSDGTKVQYIIEYEEEEEEEEAEEPTPDPAPTPEPAPTPDPEPTPEPAPAPAPAPVPKMFQKQEEPEIVLEEFKEEEECHEYAPVTFKATIDIKELVSMHFNLARSSNHDTIMNLCNAYSFEEFGKLNFRKFHVKGKFLRSEPIEALITYNEEPLYKPLLASVDESKKDLGNQISLAILTLDSQKVVRIINSDPTLIDEVYAQLIKYTSNCPNEDIAIKGWMTFLLISTLFAPTDLIRNYVISHMYKNFKNESCAIKMLAKFSFIRLKERICIGVNRHEEDSETMKLIPYACFYGLSMFHTSLYEIIWSQKKRFPKTPIPIPLYLICQALILLGLFRGKYPYLNSKPAGTNHKMFFTLIAYMPHSPVNLKNYALSNNGIDKEEKLKTVIDLLIYWLNTLTDSIIPASILDQFIELSEQNRFNAIIVLLPTVHFRTLEYLIGFLKHFLKYQKRTGMDIKKISEAFGPHIVVEPTRQLEEFQQRRVKKYAPMFCEYCLNFLDTSSLYPLNPEYITDKTKPQQPQLNA